MGPAIPGCPAAIIGYIANDDSLCIAGKSLEYRDCQDRPHPPPSTIVADIISVVTSVIANISFVVTSVIASVLFETTGTAC
jgi:hypothetical protein